MEHMKALSSTCDGGDGTGGGRGKGGNTKLMEQHVYWLWIPKYTLNRIFISLRIEKFIVFYSSSFIFHGPGVLRCTDCGSKKEKKEVHKKERDSKDWSLSPLFYTTESVASIPMFSSPVWDPAAGAGPYPLRGSLWLLSKSLWLFLTLQTSISSGFHLLPSFQGCTPSALGTEPLLLPRRTVDKTHTCTTWSHNVHFSVSQTQICLESQCARAVDPNFIHALQKQATSCDRSSNFFFPPLEYNKLNIVWNAKRLRGDIYYLKV